MNAARAFRTSSPGVRAHLEHLLLYAGRPVDNPTPSAPATCREWGVLTPWQKTFTRPITFTDLAAKWAPGTRTYPAMLKTVADRFDAEVCGRPDPRPGLVQEARAVSDQGQRRQGRRRRPNRRRRRQPERILHSAPSSRPKTKAVTGASPSGPRTLPARDAASLTGAVQGPERSTVAG